jgi:hypothetical protein
MMGSVGRADFLELAKKRTASRLRAAFAELLDEELERLASHVQDGYDEQEPTDPTYVNGAPVSAVFGALHSLHEQAHPATAFRVCPEYPCRDLIAVGFGGNALAGPAPRTLDVTA